MQAGGMEITEPVPAALQRLLRQAVLDHATGERRRVFPPVLNVGVPGLVATAFEAGPHDMLDHALRCDVVEAMVRRCRRPGPPPLVWLTRRGDLSVQQDIDLAWLAAARSAGGELGTRLPIVVVNRRCWRDPGTGVGRTWQRLRAT